MRTDCCMTNRPITYPVTVRLMAFPAKYKRYSYQLKDCILIGRWQFGDGAWYSL